MTLDEIKSRHDASRTKPGLSQSHDDRAQLLEWLEAALPFVKSAHCMSAYSINQSIGATTLLKQMGVKP
jgi:hypothetical protein